MKKNERGTREPENQFEAVVSKRVEAKGDRCKRKPNLKCDRSRNLRGIIGDVLKVMKPGERLLADLKVTDRPKSKWVIRPETRPDEIDVDDIYSATYEWLAKFSKFCRSSGGFEVF
jgi:hypothetical protein